MTLRDFFHLDPKQYAERLASLSDAEVLQLDVRQTRNLHGSILALLISLALTPQTHAVSLIGAAIALRRFIVAKQTLLLIHRELHARQLPLHYLTVRDVMYPAVGTSVGLGLGVAGGFTGLESAITAAVEQGARVAELAAEGAVEVAGDALLNVLSSTADKLKVRKRDVEVAGETEGRRGDSPDLSRT